jgi:hypothetical protein
MALSPKSSWNTFIDEAIAGLGVEESFPSMGMRLRAVSIRMSTSAPVDVRRK